MAERTCLLNKRTSKGYPGFESLSLRTIEIKILITIRGVATEGRRLHNVADNEALNSLVFRDGLAG